MDGCNGDVIEYDMETSIGCLDFCKTDYKDGFKKKLYLTKKFKGNTVSEHVIKSWFPEEVVIDPMN